MNIRDDIKQLKTGTRELRNFGLLVGGVLAALGILFLLRHRAHYPYFLWPGIVLIAFGVVLPRALKHIYIVWMALAFVLGFMMAHVILTLFLFLVITPIGLIARLAGKDFLSQKLEPKAASYWILRDASIPRQKHKHEQQF